MSNSPRRRRRRPPPRSTAQLLTQFTDLHGIPLTRPGTDPAPIADPGEGPARRRGGRQRVNQAAAPVQGRVNPAAAGPRSTRPAAPRSTA